MKLPKVEVKLEEINSLLVLRGISHHWVPYATEDFGYAITLLYCNLVNIVRVTK